MRIVADTNTVISGLLWGGPPRQILEYARIGQIRLYTSHSLLAELAEVIGRAKFNARIQAAGLSAGELIASYQRLAVRVDPQALPAPVSRDADDDEVLACASAASAAIIVSGDQDLLSLGNHGDTRILTAPLALEHLRNMAR